MTGRGSGAGGARTLGDGGGDGLLGEPSGGLSRGVRPGGGELYGGRPASVEHSSRFGHRLPAGRFDALEVGGVRVCQHGRQVGR